MTASLWSITDRLKGFIPGSRGIQSYEIIEQERQELYDLIESNDPRIRPMYEQATQAIYEASENLAVIFQPNAIFFDHWLTLLPEIGIDMIRQNFNEYTSAIDKQMIELDIISHGQYQGAVGSAILVLESSYGQIENHQRINEFMGAAGGMDVRMKLNFPSTYYLT